MKKTLKILALILTAALILCACACTGGGGEGKITVVVGCDVPVEYELDLSDVEIENGLFSVLDYLAQTESLAYTATGTMIDSVGDLKPDASKFEYIYIYTSNPADFDVSDWAQEMEYKGKKLVSSGVGAGDMTFTDGTVIYIGTIVYG